MRRISCQFDCLAAAKAQIRLLIACSLAYSYYPGSGKCYLPPSFTANLIAQSPTAQNWLNSVQSKATANAPGSPFLLQGGVTIDTTQWADANNNNLGLTAKFAAVPFDLNQVTHLTVAPTATEVVNNFEGHFA